MNRGAPRLSLWEREIAPAELLLVESWSGQLLGDELGVAAPEDEIRLAVQRLVRFPKRQGLRVDE
jgi:hypothetical protein